MDIATRWQFMLRSKQGCQLRVKSYREHSTSVPWIWSWSLTEPHSTGWRTSNTPFLWKHYSKLNSNTAQIGFFIMWSLTVARFDSLTVASEQNISRVKIPTQDALLMQTLQGQQDLCPPDAHFILRKPPTGLHGLICSPGWLDREPRQMAPPIHLYDLVFSFTIWSFWFYKTIHILSLPVGRGIMRARGEPAYRWSLCCRCTLLSRA